MIVHLSTNDHVALHAGDGASGDFQPQQQYTQDRLSMCVHAYMCNGLSCIFNGH